MHLCHPSCITHDTCISVTHHASPMTHSTVTYKLEHVPVKDVVVGEALTVEKVPEELPQVRVVWFIVKAQRAAEVQVGGKLGFRGRKTEVRSLRTSLPSMPCCCHKRQNQAVGSRSHLQLCERMKIIEMHF
uniref:Uncharacterized protein n=1 Tax=Oryzias latipes TaxID=8090 RepID=A0A3P9L8T7_ORYLA